MVKIVDFYLALLILISVCIPVLTALNSDHDLLQMLLEPLLGLIQGLL